MQRTNRANKRLFFVFVLYETKWRRYRRVSILSRGDICRKQNRKLIFSTCWAVTNVNNTASDTTVQITLHCRNNFYSSLQGVPLLDFY